MAAARQRCSSSSSHHWGCIVGRLTGWCWLVAFLLLGLSGCASGERADDPAATAVRDSHSAVATLALAVRLHLDAKATAQVAQVSLEQCLEDVALAQEELVTARDADPARRNQARAAIGAAVDVLVGFEDRVAADLGEPELARLEQAEQVLAAAAVELDA